MGIEILLHRNTEWLRGEGPESTVVVSSRIRLARNIVGFAFPGRADEKVKKQVRDIVERAVEKSACMKRSLDIHIDTLDSLDKQFLVERHLISVEHARGEAGSGLLVGDHEVKSCMINEEDHLRLQLLRSGFQLEKAFREINVLDDELEQELDYAFDPAIGYLTSCPTNVGTGLRASVMLHLPGLVLANQIKQVVQAVAKLGLAVRGLYGEGSEAAGNLFQISNQVTLGMAESDIIKNLERVITQIVGHEKNARRVLFQKNRTVLEDRVFRADALLRGARIITSKEAVDLLSTLKLGIDLQLCDMALGMINELFILTQPAHLQKIAGKELQSGQRDVFRAELIRSRLNKKE